MCDWICPILTPKPEPLPLQITAKKTIFKIRNPKRALDSRSGQA